MVGTDADNGTNGKANGAKDKLASKLPFGKKDKKGAKDEEDGGAKPDSAAGEYDVTEHLMSAEECAENLATDYNSQDPWKSKGLTEDEVRPRCQVLSCSGVLAMHGVCIACCTDELCTLVMERSACDGALCVLR